MSAYIVDPETISMIATAGHAALLRAAEQAHLAPRADAWETLVAELCDQNAASVAYRYHETPAQAVQSGTGMHPRIWRARALRRTTDPIDPESLAEACRCYRYQSCEHPGWDGSMADKLTEALATHAAARAFDLARDQAREAQARAEAERAAAIARGRAWIATHQPADATHAIIGELHASECDSQTDYFGSRVTRKLFLGWSRHGRDLFPELRKAAATRPETAHLGPGGSPDQENREKYSMGRGYFLAEERHAYHGWQVRKTYLGDHLAEIIGATLP